MAGKLRSELEQSLKESGIDIVDPQIDVDPVAQNADLRKIVEDEAFMNEVVTIMLYPTTDPNAPPYALLNVNGERIVVPRSRKVAVKRKHLEVLARMKETRWVQNVPEGYVGQIGAESLVGHTALAYPFNVIEDKNSRGAPWLENILAEAA